MSRALKEGCDSGKPRQGRFCKDHSGVKRALEGAWQVGASGQEVPTEPERFRGGTLTRVARRFRWGHFDAKQQDAGTTPRSVFRWEVTR